MESPSPQIQFSLIPLETFMPYKLRPILLFALLISLSLLAQEPSKKDKPENIQDNSFLVEEAYNL